MRDAPNTAPRRIVRRAGQGWVPAHKRPDEAPVRGSAVRRNRAAGAWGE
jgi:hypothetical protein